MIVSTLINNLFDNRFLDVVVLDKNETLDGAAVLPGFRLALAELFSEPAETDELAPQ